ncbi:MAG: RNA polymerase sigma factor [Candidatus Brocadiia bacterium]
MSGDENKLLTQFVEGDESAFEQLILMYQARLVSFFFRCSWDRSTAEDLAQETFVRVYSSLRKENSGMPFGVLLFRNAKLVWFNTLRRKYRAGKALEKLEENTRHEQKIKSGTGSVDELDRTEKIRRLHEALEELDSDHRLIVEMSYFMGLQYKEIADILDIPLGTVKSRISHAMTRLRGMMEKDKP